LSLGGPAYAYLVRATPDSRKLVAFVLRPSAEILRFGATGPMAAPLLGGARAWHLAYSPDRSLVAWASAEDWPPRLWVSRADGTGRLQLGETSVAPQAPMTWSPDGRWIAFSSLEGWARAEGTVRSMPAGADVRFRMYLASPSAATVEPLAADPDDADQLDPCWSPDGRRLAYGIGPSGLGVEPYLRRVDLATRFVTKLEGSEGLWSPKCTRDGRIVANDWLTQTRDYSKDSSRDWFGTNEGRAAAGRAFYKVRDPMSGRWKPLVVEMPPGSAVGVWGLGYTSWSGDGRHLYAVLGPQLVRVTPASGHLEVVADMAGVATPTGWLGLDPEDALLVVRDASQREIVTMDLETR
jgi:hypothetical protein